jgi:hypothetical protein
VFARSSLTQIKSKLQSHKTLLAKPTRCLYYLKKWSVVIRPSLAGFDSTADTANELAEMIKTGVVAKEVFETLKIEPGKVTILLSHHPLANLVISGVKEVTQKWMKQRAHFFDRNHQLHLLERRRAITSSMLIPYIMATNRAFLQAGCEISASAPSILTRTIRRLRSQSTL